MNFIADQEVHRQHLEDRSHFRPIKHNYVPVLIVALSAAVRLPALFSDFWLDEAWSLSATQKLASAAEVFTKFNSDNNHHLNSLFLYALGDQRYWELYRIPSLLSGVAIVLLAWWIARPEGFLEAVLASTLTGSSYLLIHYSSEARGYSLVVMFAFAGFYSLRRFADQPAWPWAVAFWGCTALGTLSHVEYLYFFFAALIWFPLQQSRRRADAMSVVGPLLRAFCVPGAFLLFFYLAVARRILVAGSLYYNRTLDVLVETLSMAGGGPPGGPAALAVSLIVLLAFLAAILWQRRRDPPLCDFYLIVIVYPTVLLTAHRVGMLEPRYFLVSVAFGLLAVSGLLADLVRRGPSAKVAVAVALALFAAGNALHTKELIQYGRGGYKSALRYMENHTSGSVIGVASNHYFPDRHYESHPSGPVIIAAEDHYFPIHLLLTYYEKFLQPGKALTYYSASEYPSDGSQWFLLDSFDRSDPVPLEFVDPRGNTYRLERKYPHSVLSGATWHLYQRLRRSPGEVPEPLR